MSNALAARCRPCASAWTACLLLATPLFAQAPPEADPESARAKFLAKIDRRLRVHPFFSKVTFRKSETDPRFVLIIQAPAKDRRNYDRRIEERYGPWLQELDVLFQKEFVEPLALEDNGVLPAFPMAVLASHGDYINYADASQSGDLYAARAHYEPKLRLAVTYEDSFRKVAPHLVRRPALHEFVHALQHRYCANREQLPEVLFFNEGLADYLSYHLGRTPDVLRERPIDEKTARRFLQLHGNSALRRVYLHTVPELLEVTSYGDLLQRTMTRAASSGSGFDGGLAMAAFYAEAYLFVHYLHHGAGGEHTDAWKRAVRSILTGRDGPRAFAEAGLDPAQLDQGFTEYVYAALGREPGASAVAVADAQVHDTAPPDLGLLALSADDVETRLAQAVLAAMRGDADGALSEMDAILAGATGAAAERVGIERMRLDAWIQLRDAYLEDVIARGTTLRVEVDGELVQTKIAAIEAGALKLAAAKGGREEIPLDALEPLQLMKRLGSKAEAYGPDWLRIYPNAVLGDAKWQRLLAKRSSPDLDALRADAADYYPRARGLAEVALALRTLQDLGPTDDPEEADRQIETLRDLLQDHGDLELVEERRPTLKQAAAYGLEVVFQQRGAEELLAGRVTKDDDATNVHYDTAAALAADFVEDVQYLSDNHDRRGGISFPETGTAFGIQGGALRGRGATAFRYRLPLAAPTSIRARVRWDVQNGVPNNTLMVLLGISGDEHGNYVAQQGLIALHVLDKPTGTVEMVPSGQQQIILGQTYTLEVRQDADGTVRSFVDGRHACSAPATSRMTGRPFVWIHSDANVKVSDIEVSGRFAGSALSEARGAWVEASLKEMGFE